MNTLRRRLIRKGINDKVEFMSSSNIAYIVKNYQNYMIKQKSPPSNEKLKEIKKLLKNLIIKNKLMVNIALTKKKGTMLYVCICLR